MSAGDTSLGAPGDRFPPTRETVLDGLRSAQARERDCAFDALVSGYWRPVYKYVRIKWNATNEQAKDLTQEFFARAWEKRFFDTYDPARSAFRTFLRTCLDRFVSNERLAASRLKRGGGRRFVSLDFDSAESELNAATATDDPDQYFRREWMRGLFGDAVDALRADCEARDRHAHFEIFERYDLADGVDGKRPTYAQLAERYDLTAARVTNYLSQARRRFRRLLLDRLRSLCGSEAEYRADARDLFGIETE
jgi:RNA polymerase sigma factor (sigma-70 family)